MAMFLLAAGYLIVRTAMLPAWAGRSAYVVAAINMAFVPSLYFGGDAKQFYSAIGWGTSVTITGLLFYWGLAVSVSLLRASRQFRASRQ